MYPIPLLLSTLLLIAGCGGGGGGSEQAASSAQSSSSIVSSATSSLSSAPSSSMLSSSASLSSSSSSVVSSVVSSVSSTSSSSNSSVVVVKSEGQVLYETHCAICHGADAKGDIGPNIQTALAVEIGETILAQDIMRHLIGVINEPEQILIADYLKELKNGTVANPTETVEEQRIALGRALFFDPNLSLRRSMSCSTCHNPAHAFVDARHLEANTTNTVYGALSVGDDGVTLGGRNAPTIGYAKFAPDFTQLQDGTYQGGMFHDGRAKNLKEQAKGPLLDQAEMMMPNAQSVLSRVQENSEYVAQMKALYGESIFNDTDAAYDALAQSIAAFEKTDAFASFDSKYDRSKLSPSDPAYYAMSAQEQQGYALFFDANRTACVLCHSLNSRSEGTREIFSNFQYENTGTPRNLQALLARDGNTDTVDYGLGGRSDINDSAHYGKVKVPTLRNIAVTGPYMSNGVFRELRTVVLFYDFIAGHNTHPINPETAEPWGDAEHPSTINHTLLSRMQPLSEEEIDALVAFLKTLTDARYEALIP